MAPAFCTAKIPSLGIRAPDLGAFFYGTTIRTPKNSVLSNAKINAGTHRVKRGAGARARAGVILCWVMRALSTRLVFDALTGP